MVELGTMQPGSDVTGVLWVCSCCIKGKPHSSQQVPQDKYEALRRQKEALQVCFWQLMKGNPLCLQLQAACVCGEGHTICATSPLCNVDLD